MDGQVKPGHDGLTQGTAVSAPRQSNWCGVGRRRVISTHPRSSSIGGGNKRLFVPCANGIVTPDPVGVAVDAACAGGDLFLLRQAIAHMLEASIGQGESLHPMQDRKSVV